MKEVSCRPDVRQKKSAAMKVVCADSEYIAEMSANRKAEWKRPGYKETLLATREKNYWDDPEAQIRRSIAMDKVWDDPDFRKRHAEAMAKVSADPEWHKNLSEAREQLWDDPEYRQFQSELMLKRWKRGDFEDRDYSGEKNPAWQGGGSLEPYGPAFNDALKLQIRTRDAFRCQVCGEQENGRAHDCHHINYDKLDSTEGNLVTLCQKCHRRTNFDRPYWQAYFTGEGYHLMLGAC